MYNRRLQKWGRTPQCMPVTGQLEHPLLPFPTKISEEQLQKKWGFFVIRVQYSQKFHWDTGIKMSLAFSRVSSMLFKSQPACLTYSHDLHDCSIRAPHHLSDINPPSTLPSSLAVPALQQMINGSTDIKGWRNKKTQVFCCPAR